MVSLEEALKYNKKQIASYVDKPYETVKRWTKDKLRQAIVDRHADLAIANKVDGNDIVETLEQERQRRTKELSLNVLKKIEILMPKFGDGKDGLNPSEAKILTLFLEQQHKIELEAIKARFKKR